MKATLNIQADTLASGIFLDQSVQVQKAGVYKAEIISVEKVGTNPDRLKVYYKLWDAQGTAYTYDEVFQCLPRNIRWNTFLGYINSNCLVTAGMDASALTGLQEIIQIEQNGPYMSVVQRMLCPKGFKTSDLGTVFFGD